MAKQRLMRKTMKNKFYIVGGTFVLLCFVFVTIIVFYNGKYEELNCQNYSQLSDEEVKK